MFYLTTSKILTIENNNALAATAPRLANTKQHNIGTHNMSHAHLRLIETHTLPPAKDPSVVHVTVRLGCVVVGLALPAVRLPRAYVRATERHDEILRAV